MSEIDWGKIRADYESGLSLRALEEKYHVSKSVIGERKFKEQWDKPHARTKHRTPNKTPDAVRPQPDTDSTPKKDLSTKDTQRLFLEAYAIQANVMVAAREAGIHRTTVYDWLEKDEDFSFAYNLAKEAAKDVLREEIFKRGHDGWDEPVFQSGFLVGTVHKKSDTLLMFHAKMLMPEYREKSTVDVNATHTNAQNAQARHDAVMKILDRFPEAKWALAEELAELERTGSNPSRD